MSRMQERSHAAPELQFLSWPLAVALTNLYSRQFCRKNNKRRTSARLTVGAIVAYLLLQVVRGDVAVWLRPLTSGRRLEFSTATVTAAAQTAAAVKAGQDATDNEQRLREKNIISTARTREYEILPSSKCYSLH